MSSARWVADKLIMSPNFIRYRGRILWRINDNCVEVDASTWHSGRLHRSGFDWSGQPSGHTLEDVRPVAVELAARYLRLPGGPSDLDLAEASTPDFSHPAVPRYLGLAEVVAALGIAERQGIGVARMTRDMLAVGRPRPQIDEIAGPYVRVTLLGGEPDPEMIRLVSDVFPQELAESVDVLLLIDELCARGWVDAGSAAAVLQRPAAEAADAIERLAAAKLGDADDAMCRRPLDLVPGVIDQVAGTGSAGSPAYRLSDESRYRIGHRCARLQSVEGQHELLLGWARGRGRVSSTEAADLVDVSVVTAGRRLADLAADGLLAPSRPNGTGRGFHYLPAPG